MNLCDIKTVKQVMGMFHLTFRKEFGQNFLTDRSVVEDIADAENLQMIEQSAKNADIVIFAAGTGRKADKRVQTRQKEVLATLKKYDKKLFCIADNDGKKFYHPLCPKVKKWNLVKFDIEELTKKGYDYD